MQRLLHVHTCQVAFGNHCDYHSTTVLLLPLLLLLFLTTTTTGLVWFGASPDRTQLVCLGIGGVRACAQPRGGHRAMGQPSRAPAEAKQRLPYPPQPVETNGGVVDVIVPCRRTTHTDSSAE